MSEAGKAKMGQPMNRLEDPKLVTGNGCYVDDIKRDGMLHLDFLRSPYAHADILSIDTDAALALPGVVAIYTGADLADKLGPVPSFSVPGNFFNTPDMHMLALDKVRFVGEMVVAVVASDRYIARDARELIKVNYKPLPAVTDIEKALLDDAPLVHESMGSNRAFMIPIGDAEGAAKALEGADVVVKERLINQRVIPNPMETRGVVAEYSPWDNELTAWISTQAPQNLRRDFAKFLDHPDAKLRVIAPDVGGGFGPKGAVYPDELMTVYVARELARPVKWIEERQESMMATTHARGQVYDVEMGVNRDGSIQGLRIHMLAHMGAHYGANTPVTAMVTAACITGAYKIPHAVLNAESVFTHTTCIDAYRGFGRTESSYLIERMVNRLAQEIDMDPVELRHKNFIQPDEFPYITPMNNTYDDGHYEVSMSRALEMADYDALREQQRVFRAKGRYVGIGVSSHVWRASFRMPDTHGTDNWCIGGWEKSTVTVSDNGGVTVTIGTCSMGQGIATATAQVVADVLSIDTDNIKIVEKDTFAAPFGNGSMGSRSMVTGGSATLLAAKKARAKILRLAAHLLDSVDDELELKDGCVLVVGQPEKSVSLFDIARLSLRGQEEQPLNEEPTIEESAVYEIPKFAPEFATHTAAWGTHLCLVEVQPATGKIDILRYIAVDDVGRAINPKICAGQIHGGVAQGLGQALMEEAVYDDDGQLLTSSFLDYCTPKATDMPWLEVDFTETPNPTNALGVRGVGESGTCGASPVLVNAVVDALSPLGVTHIDMPLKPEKVWKAIQQVQGDVQEASRHSQKTPRDSQQAQPRPQQEQHA